MSENRPFPALAGHFLMAMPNIDDTRFDKAVIYIYAHSETAGAQGIMINRPTSKMSLGEILMQLNMTEFPPIDLPPILIGGPEQLTRGFILHTPDYTSAQTKAVTPEVSLTATQDILQDIMTGKGPAHFLVALGHCNWIRGQLEDEIMTNVWLTAPASADILFHEPFAKRWEKALGTLGVAPALLAGESGKA